MDEQNRDQLEQQTPQPKQDAPEHKTESVTQARDRTRRNLIHTVCGGYLAYLSYKMFRSFSELITSEGWSGNTIISLAGGVVFAVVAVLLLVGVVRRVLRQMRENS